MGAGGGAEPHHFNHCLVRSVRSPKESLEIAGASFHRLGALAVIQSSVSEGT